MLVISRRQIIVLTFPLAKPFLNRANCERERFASLIKTVSFALGDVFAICSNSSSSCRLTRRSFHNFSTIELSCPRSFSVALNVSTARSSTYVLVSHSNAPAFAIAFTQNPIFVAIPASTLPRLRITLASSPSRPDPGSGNPIVITTHGPGACLARTVNASSAAMKSARASLAL